MYVDSHCHLSFPELVAQWPQIRSEMRQAQVAAALCVCTHMEEFDAIHALASSEPWLWASVGVHPDTEGALEPSVDDLVRAAQSAKVIAIGETGLDYYRLGTRTVVDMEWQRERFRVHIRAARETGLPLIIHTRGAGDDTLRLLREEGAGQVTGVFHCFTDTMAVAQAALELGFYISFSGILSFRNAEDLRAVARSVPMERCLIETDSPYLAPMPHRGKTNTPAYLPYVAKALAQEKALSAEAVGEATRINFERLFKVTVPALEISAT
ncbi:MAG: DNAase [Ideonella sp. MAG2]|nr:MAG: DNAase [Ideonella sp. MAG2]